MLVKELFQEALLEYDEEPPSELQGVLAYSGVGKMYVATDDGRLRSADVRQHLLTGEWAQAQEEQRGAKTPPMLVRTILPTPKPELSATHFVLNRSGTYAALAGPTTQDPETSSIAVVDLSSCRPSREGDYDIAASISLDSGLFEARAGLRVLQVAWHPDSDCHLAVLTSDATWRLYNTQRPDLAEQTFELQLRGRRRLGLDGESHGQLPVAFAFGGGEGWDRLAVYFCTAAGQLYTLCPVVPFGCRYPARLVEGLRQAAELASAGGEVAQAPTSLAWLEGAFQPAPASAGAGPAGGSLLYSVPHALEEHTPSLAGPLPVEIAEADDVSLTSLAGGRDSVQALLLTRYGTDCTALAIATSAGTLGLYLLAGEGAEPRWAESTPQCITEGSMLLAVRSQVPTALAPSPTFLLLDVVRLGLGAAQQQGGGGDDYDDEYGEAGLTHGRSVALCADPAVAERLYCVHTAGAHAVTLGWLPLLSDFMANLEEGGAGGSQAALPPALPAPAVEQLLASKPGAVDGVAVGDALCRTALIALEANGTPHCLRTRLAAEAPPLTGPAAARAGAATAGGRAADGGGAAAGTAATPAAAVDRDVEAHVARVYGDLLSGSGTAQLPAPPPGPLGSGNPAGQRHLSTSMAALRSSHVEFAHQAHHDLLQRLHQLKGELEKQESRRERLAELAAGRAQAGDSLEARLARVALFQENLSSRLALLGQLHWSLPRPPSEAERALKHSELPEWETASRQLEGDIKALHGRVAALQRKARSMGQVAASQAALAVQVPPQQLRRMREALAQQEALIEANLDLLGALEAAAAEHEELGQL